MDESIRSQFARRGELSPVELADLEARIREALRARRGRFGGISGNGGGAITVLERLYYDLLSTETVKRNAGRFF